MRIARSQLMEVGRAEDYWFFAVADATCKAAGMRHVRADYREAV